MSDDDRRTEVHAPGARGVQVGPHNTQHNTFVVKVSALAVTVAAAAGLVFTYQYQGRGDHEKTAAESTPSVSWSAPARPEPAPDDDTPTPEESEEEAAESPEESATPSTDPPSSPAFDATTLDVRATDRTPVTVAALLPDSFTDSKGVRYTRNSGGVWTCGSLSRNSAATTALASVGCVDDPVVTGTYVDTDQNILVMVEVFALADKAGADSAHARLKNDNSGGWRYRCPNDGTGSGVCRDSAALRGATQYGYTGSSHRYLVSTVAVPVDLRQDDRVKSWLVTASYRASVVAGPGNYPGNR
ncbi:hypothetical protein ABZ896_12780 [Streptomyces sp. NPDC047072]|uniref:hypothetical protein n=1 Tax=Streptomyces sp. NPDC047072 TaxID=3154809 RepID=UPI0033DEE0B8